MEMGPGLDHLGVIGDTGVNVAVGLSMTSINEKRCRNRRRWVYDHVTYHGL